MALVTTGLPNGGTTTFYRFKYDSALGGAGGVEPARTAQAMQSCDADFQQMQNWFTGVTFPFSTPMEVDVTNTSGGTASWGPPVQLNSTTEDAGYLRMLLIAEVTEMFMKAQAAALGISGWFPGTEGSLGEGLSRFLAEQFLLSSALGLGEFPDWGWTADDWLATNPWPDWVNNKEDSGYDKVNTGCSILFIYYLFHQLGFTANQIVAAAAETLAGVFANLTQAIGDPFPFFKRLLTAFPGQGGAPGAPNRDDPFPIGLVSVWEEKSAFGLDEVHDIINQHGGRVGAAFWVVVEGFSQTSFNSLGISVELDGSLKTTNGITVVPSTVASIDYEDTAKPNAPQRIRIPYDIVFTTAADPAFPPTGSTTPNELDLHVELQIGGEKVNASDAYAAFELVAGADPYFTNVDPHANNVFYLSQDLRVFTVTPALDATPIAGATFGSDSSAGAYQYIQDLLEHLNGASAFTSGSQDPFAAFPDQGGAFSGDSSVTPISLTLPPHNNYNFAIARVRLQGTSGPSAAAQNVRVFFRLWVSQSADTDYQPTTTYAFTADAAGLPGSPRVGAGITTIPFFATGTIATNTDYVSNGVNNQTIEIDSGDQAWAYFGCFLDVYDPANTVSGMPVQAWLAGTHHCLVAQIACDSAPILTGGSVTASPENSDKLAQRNLQVSTSDNPGGAETHRIPQTFDARPSRPALGKSGIVDELMIDWGNVPVGSLAQIFWPHVDAGEVVSLADERYAFHTLRVADSHTVECEVTRAVTYVPIPPGSGENYAGLFTIDLPSTVRTGQEFNVVVRRVVTAHQTRHAPPPPPGLQAAVPAEAPRRVTQAAATAAPRPPGTVTTFEPLLPAERTETVVVRALEQEAVHRSWRYVTGAFQVRIPVWTGDRILPVDENTLAIMKWRYGAMAPANRWRPVLKRYIDYLAERVRGLGGDPDQIPPSVTGWHPTGQGEPGRRARDYVGTVARIVFDCHGDIDGFVLDDCCHEQAFQTRDPGLAEFLVRAFRDRFRILVRVCEPGGRIQAVEIVR